jgi:transposase-like protein
MARRIREDWQEVVAEYLRSGQTRRTIARRHGISVDTLRRWTQRHRAEGRLSLLPVRVVASPAPSARGPVAEGAAILEVELPSGVKLAVPFGADTEYVADLVRRLLA